MAENGRKVVPVNESVIQAMIAGDVPGRRQETEMPPVEDPPADVGQQEEAAPGPRPRKRREQKGYADIFLEKIAPMPRKHTYISVAMYNELLDTLPVIARGLTIPNFLENLLRHHFDTHQDEIDELYEQKTKKRR
jgi:hypothetical protein